jgi:hypothetical protein
MSDKEIGAQPTAVERNIQTVTAFRCCSIVRSFQFFASSFTRQESNAERRDELLQANEACRSGSARITGAFNFIMVSLGSRAKTRISENEVCFSQSWYWILERSVRSSSPAHTGLLSEELQECNCVIHRSELIAGRRKRPKRPTSTWQ